MKKTVFLLAGLFLTTISAFSQITTLPYTQGFETEFTLSDPQETPVEFLPNWIGNDVRATSRIFKDNAVFNNGGAAMSVIPTGSFDGDVRISLDLTNYTNVSVALAAKSMANGTGNRAAILTMSTSVDGGANWGNIIQIGSFPNQDHTSFNNYSYGLAEIANNNATVLVRLAVTGSDGSGTRAKLVIDDVNITGTEGVSTIPVISVSPESLEFSQILGAPSVVQTMTVTASNFSESLLLTVLAPFEIALTENGVYAASQTLTLTNGGFNGNVFVRLNSANQGDYTSGLTVQSGETNLPVNFSLTGTASPSLVSNPAPFDLSSGNYSFTEWAGTSSAGTYPANMILWINAAGDGVESTLTDEYIQDWECGYEVESASRFLGEGEKGLAFYNTGNTVTNANCYGTAEGGRIVGKPGAVVLALNTLNRENVEVQWRGRTILSNNRLYALRLQYRIGDGGGNPNIGWTEFETISEYLKNATNDHFQDFTVAVPQSLNNLPIVQLRWVYFQHETNTASGSRAELALDEVFVTSEALLSREDFTLNPLKIYPNPATDTVNFSQEVNATIFDTTGKKVLSAENTTSVNISQLAKGMYLIKTSEGVATKLIKI